MYIAKVKRFLQDELFEKLRDVPLVGRPDVFPYRDAKFEIRWESPANVQPSALYVLRQNLRFITLLLDNLSWHIGESGHPDSLIEYEDEYGDYEVMIPPIVELTDFGEWMILDGQHRSFITRHRIATHRGTAQPMLFISDVSVPFPYNSLPASWESVEIVDQVPKTKRIYRPGISDTPEAEQNHRRDLRLLGSRGFRPVA